MPLMSRRPLRLLTGLLLTLALTAGLGAALSSPAEAAVGKVRGAVVGRDGTAPKVKVLYFAQDWTYLGQTKAYGGGYSLSLEAGRYHLQFVDQAPAYDVDKYAPTDVAVTVRAGTTTVKNVRMRKGAAIGGTARAGGKAAGGARVVAANTSEQSFETVADKQGNFALGGLPAGTYSVFTYDKARAYVGTSVYLKKVKAGTFRRVPISLTKRAGSLLVDVYGGDQPLVGSPFVTAVSRTTGQFWTAKVSQGSVTFRGLYPGRYRLVVPGAGDYLAATGNVKRGRVKPGRLAFGSFTLTERGARITGQVVDGADPSYPLAGAQVLLFDARGARLGDTTSAADGSFAFAGQLTTQSGLSVVAQPTGSPYLGQGTHYCKYAAATLGSISATAGTTTALAPVGLAHLPNAQQDGQQCWTAAGRAPGSAQATLAMR